MNFFDFSGCWVVFGRSEVVTHFWVTPALFVVIGVFLGAGDSLEAIFLRLAVTLKSLRLLLLKAHCFGRFLFLEVSVFPRFVAKIDR